MQVDEAVHGAEDNGEQKKHGPLRFDIEGPRHHGCPHERESTRLPTAVHEPPTPSGVQQTLAWQACQDESVHDGIDPHADHHGIDRAQ